MSYRIGSFNVYKLGRNATNDRIQYIARIIKDNDLDIVALQEVLNYEAAKRLLIYLDGVSITEIHNPCPNKNGGSMGMYTKNWELRWVKPASLYQSAIAEEGYAFIWNKRRIGLVQNRNGKVFEPRIINQYKIRNSLAGVPLVRPPFYGRFSPVNKIGGCFCEFRLINTHVIFSKNSAIQKREDHEEYLSSNETSYRNSELEILIKDILPQVSDKEFDYIFDERNVENLSVYTFLLGDYNLNLPEAITENSKADMLTDICQAVLSDGKIMNTGQHQLTTVRKEQKDKIDPVGNIPFILNPELHFFANNFDHVTYDIKRMHEMGVYYGIRRIDAYEIFSNDLEAAAKLYRESVSDHLPIVLEVELNKVQ